MEYPEIREFVKTIDNVTWVKPKIPFNKVIKQYGYPVISKEVSRNVGDVQKLGENCWAIKCFTKERGIYSLEKWSYLIDAPFKISNRCCDIMKKNPLRKIKLKPFIGSLACESRQRKTQYLKTGCNAFNNKNPVSNPLGFWTEQNILEYIREFDILYSPIYGNIIKSDNKLVTTGEPRTGCMFCAFGVHLESEPNKFQRMKQSHPKQYDYCINKLGLREVLDYIGVKY